ncbi:MAG: energy-coupling factor transporter transmembrane protein EcfT [Methanomicrobiales archaeon]|nr:energy-coupling factor transporter transmembrane protein EcfT [Methanomicrobiales archaeon]
MSALPASSHLPDLDLITYFAERQGSLFSRVSPWTKAVLLVALILEITVMRNILVLLGLYLAVLALFLLAGLPVGKLFTWYLYPLLFVLSLVGILAWAQPGIPVFSLAAAGIPLALTDQGLLLVVTLTLKTLISVTFTFFFLMTTRYEHLSGMISRILPAPLDQILLMAYRFFFLTLAMAGSILKAVRSRGGAFVRGFFTQGALYAGIIGLVFIRSLDRAERVHKAMLARGFTGSYASTTEVPVPGIAEAGGLAACIAVLAATLLMVPGGGW